MLTAGDGFPAFALKAVKGGHERLISTPPSPTSPATPTRASGRSCSSGEGFDLRLPSGVRRPARPAGE